MNWRNVVEISGVNIGLVEIVIVMDEGGGYCVL